jgi:S1-C subfamily serine protease
VALFLAWLIALAAAPQTAVLRITVSVTAADGSTHPVPRHVLLISDDPVTASPQRFVTKADGTAEAHLKPGKYVVESDNPYVLDGQAYEWSQPVKVAATGETTLALTAANAAIEAAKPGAAPTVAAVEERVEGSLLADWKDSIVIIWTPARVGRGFLMDARGLVVTNQRLIETATTVEVQVSATTKVAGRVVANDPNRNVAIIWIDPRAVAPARPLTPAFSPPAAPLAERDTVYAIEAPASGARSVISGTVDRVSAHTVSSDVPLGRDSAGVPLLNASGRVVAITTSAEEASAVNEISPRSVRIDDAQSALAEAGKKIEGAAPPSATPLPMDPDLPFPEEALKKAAKARGASLSPYLVAASDFEVNIITPPVLYGSLHKSDDGGHFDYARDDHAQAQAVLNPLDDFGTWREYVSDAPPVVLIRVTPKFGENFWTTVARGAAQTQGVAIPAIKRPKAGFGGLRLSCGDKEIAPIHPFRIEHRLDGSASIDEGLYAFDVSAFSPQCGRVSITLFSDKPSDKGDTRTVDAKIVQQVWDDFAPYR